MAGPRCSQSGECHVLLCHRDLCHASPLTRARGSELKHKPCLGPWEPSQVWDVTAVPGKQTAKCIKDGGRWNKWRDSRERNDKKG